MIITRKTGLALIKRGKGHAECVMTLRTNYGDKLYVVLSRLDLQRTDHYPAIYADQKRYA